MTLIDLALTTYTESEAERADTADDLAAEALAEFMKHARASAAATLCEAAADLDWQYVTEGLPSDVEEARAPLQPGRPEYLRYRIDHDEETIALELVQPRTDDRISPVTSLYNLGKLLTPATDTANGPGKEQAEQPGPLAGVEQAQLRAAQVAALARRLLSEYPDSGLSADTASVFGHQDGDGSAELHLSTEGLQSLRQIAAALEAEVTVRVSNGHGVVLEHGTATGTVDGVTVRLRAYEPMPADQAAAWLAQQDQAADAEAGDA